MWYSEVYMLHVFRAETSRKCNRNYVSKQQAEVNKILLRRFHSTVLNDGHSQLLAHD